MTNITGYGKKIYGSKFKYPTYMLHIMKCKLIITCILAADCDVLEEI